MSDKQLLTEPVQPAPPALASPPIMHQRWEQLAYFHWAYDPAEVQSHLPNGLTVDTFDGAAWVGLIPFEMRDIQFGRTPAIPHFGTFTEINVRTYVVDAHGRRAIWFFSLDVPLASVTAAARTIFGVPYCWSHTEHHVSGVHHHYTFDRQWPKPGTGVWANASIAFDVGAKIAEPSHFDHWMSARWALVSKRFGRLDYGRVFHPPWPLHEVENVDIDESALRAAGLSAPQGQPHARYSPGVPVSLAWFERI